MQEMFNFLQKWQIKFRISFYLEIGERKENDKSWFQNGSIDDKGSVPASFFK